MKRPIYVVDAFAGAPYSGNPAAVCPLEARESAEWMQKVAMEMNHAETAFVTPVEEGYEIRWFTPTVEVALCGHATLASAHILWETGRVASDATIRFRTLQSGDLTCQRRGERIAMDFPAKRAEECSPPEGMTAALGKTPSWIGANGMDYLALFDYEEDIIRMRPDHAAVAALGVRGIIVTAQSSGNRDFVSRFFAPGSGIPEDPVTGSAHCALGPFWASRLGKTSLVGFQASPRGGYVHVDVEADRCLLSGTALTTLEGMLLC